MKTHTPGPWTVHNGGESQYLIKGDNWCIATTDAPHASMNSTEKANAQLIAAAPEFLAFAVHVLKSGACQGIPGLEGYAHQIISKALGGPSEPSEERSTFVRNYIKGAV